MGPVDFVRRAVGVPFVTRGRSYDGADCYGLVFLAYRDALEIPIPSYADEYVSARPSRALADLIARESRAWRRVDDEPRWFGDVLLLRREECGGRAAHCALALDARRMLHTEAGIDACVEMYDSPLWRDRVAGVFRRDP